MLMRFDPFRDFDRLTQALLPQGAARPTSMPMDAYREGDQFIVEFDLPGIDPGSIDLTVEKNALTVRAQRTWEPKESQEVLISERPQGTFTRQLFLGEGLDADNIQASYDHGVLRLTIPVAEQAKPRKVQITAGESRAIPASATEA
ncbi:MAG TPA: Hsp20/alpha crystallin family protein [Acidimicrobiales bacterium]|jgi:HSP20 family protein|nr:Hsp20/alpha crystallin family protein [Acidimicrobiales bacterium]